ncbi:hypothetical protein K2P96_02015 [Patescibacteria group bacterium]|nr:hypothetical protein [Patescibacteria group bacterium]
MKEGGIEKAQKQKEEAPKVLSFAEFTSRYDNGMKVNNNFHLNFSGGLAGDIYRKSPHYQRFAEEHPEKAADLIRRVS